MQSYIKGKFYSTLQSTPVCGVWIRDNESTTNHIIELFISPGDQFFFVTYDEETQNNFMQLTTEDDILLFINTYKNKILWYPTGYKYANKFLNVLS